ncbi:hypothetical protein POM88_025055 [Heracleum sosnowskyi]|uniref:Uncharacterized protein n=1 Tax=Heracleum sosnowskyi TaxID=360622 RepID=A0AAD8I476_9APIA|nr:hypothetical protein POM88_025055 [Heracleum sosnowskyi]
MVIIPDCVINYFTVDGNYQPVSFSGLPLVWSKDEAPGNSDIQIFLCGTAVTGKKCMWMQLQRPTRSFKWNLKADGSALWTHLHKAFSSTLEEAYLLSHLLQIQEVLKRDKDLAKSEGHVNRATKKITFKADIQEDYEDTNDDVDDDETVDSVCVLCDDGGELI